MTVSRAVTKREEVYVESLGTRYAQDSRVRGDECSTDRIQQLYIELSVDGSVLDARRSIDVAVMLAVINRANTPLPPPQDEAFRVTCLYTLTQPPDIVEVVTLVRDSFFRLVSIYTLSPPLHYPFAIPRIELGQTRPPHRTTKMKPQTLALTIITLISTYAAAQSSSAVPGSATSCLDTCKQQCQTNQVTCRSKCKFSTGACTFGCDDRRLVCEAECPVTCAL